MNERDSLVMDGSAFCALTFLVGDEDGLFEGVEVGTSVGFRGDWLGLDVGCEM